MMKNFTRLTLAICLSLICQGSIFAQAVFTDSYAAGVTFEGFGGSTNAVSVDNTEKNAGTSSLKVVVPAAGYTGGALKAATAQNLTTYNALTFWAKASAAKSLNVSGIGNNGTTNTYQTEYNAVALTTTWKKYIIPIPNAAKLTAEDGLFHFAEGSDEGAYTIWFDDIQYETLATGVIGTFVPAIATETINVLVGANFPINGASVTVPVNAVNQTLSIGAANFAFTSSNTTVATVSATGQGTALAAGSTTITAKLGTINAAGALTVNVTAASNPTASAPTPTQAAANVISLFSNAYTNVPVDTWSASWDNANVENFVIGTNDTTKKYTSLVFAGIEFTSKPIDASTMTHFRMDIWSPNATEFKIKLVDFGANKAFGGGDDSEHELVFNATSTPAIATNKWISFDIPLSSFTGLKAKASLAQMILVSSNSTVFVDNVYFYKGAVAPTSPSASAPTPTQAAANVISLFSNAYTNVPVDTWSASWDNADVENFIIGTNDTTKKYTKLVFAGVEFTTKPVDASTMTNFRMDIWSPDATEFKIKLVDFGANKAFGGGDDSEHELVFNATSTPAISTGKWISFDIPLSSFTGLKAKASLAQMILVSSNSTVFVDNVYFYKGTVAPTSPSASAPTPTQAAANVISLFSNAYTNVPVDTWSASWDNADVENFVIGTNDTTKKYTKLVFAGVEFTTKPVDASTMTNFRMDIWSPDATEFKIKLVDFGANKAFGGGDDSEHELVFNATSTPAISTGKWISFDIPLSSFTGLKAKASLAQMILVSSNSTVFVDNVYFYKTSTSTKDVRFVQDMFKAYPSVSDESLMVELTSAPINKTKTLTIMNTTGATVFNQILSTEQTTIPVKSLPNGLYIVVVRAGDVMQTQKIIIQH